MYANAINGGAGPDTKSLGEREPAAPTLNAESGRRAAREIGVLDEAERRRTQTAVPGGDKALEAEILAQIIPAFGIEAAYGASGTLDQEAIGKLFLVLCDNLKRYALSGALDETETGQALAEKMDELKDQIIELQDEIQEAVFEVEKAEAAAQRTGIANLAMAWVGVVAAALSAALTCGASTPLLAMAVAGAVCSSINASLQTAVFAGAENIDPSSDAYRRGTIALMALELICCLGAPAFASCSGPKGIKALMGMGGQTGKTLVDDVTDDVVEVTAKKLSQQTSGKIDNLQLSSLSDEAAKSPAVKLDKGLDVQKPTKKVADIADDAVKEAPLPKLEAEVPPANLGQKAQSNAAKLSDEPGALAVKSDKNLQLSSLSDEAAKSPAVKLDKGLDVQKPTKKVADIADDAVKEAPLPKLEAEVPPANLGQKAQSNAAKLSDEPGALAVKSDKASEAPSARMAKDQDDHMDKAIKKQAPGEDAEMQVLAEISANLHYNTQRFAALIDAIQIVGQATASAVSIKSRQRLTEAQLEAMSLRSKSSTAENALEHLGQDRMLADQRRSEFRYVDANLLDAQLDHIQQGREVGLSIAEWRRF